MFPQHSDDLLESRAAIRTVLGELESTSDVVDRFVSMNELHAALEISLLWKVDRRGYDRVVSTLHGLVPRTRNSTPFRLVTQTLIDLDQDEIIDRVARTVRHYEPWQLSKLFRYPAFRSNAECFRSYVRWLTSNSPDAETATPKQVLNTYILGFALLDGEDMAEFRRWLASYYSSVLDNWGRRSMERLLLAPQPPHAGLEQNHRPRLRIALEISGQMRGYEQAFPTWEQTGIFDHEADVYVHTWRNIGRRYPDPSIVGSFKRRFGDTETAALLEQAGLDFGMKHLEREYPTVFNALASSDEVTESDIRGVYGSEATVVIEDETVPPFDQMSNQDKMHYKIHAAHELSRSNKPYDLVVRIRPDRFMDDRDGRVPWRQVLDESRLNRRIFSEENKGLRENLIIGDQVAVGTPELIDVYASTWLRHTSGEFHDLHGVPRSLTGHSSLAYALLYELIDVRRLPNFPSGRPIDPSTVDGVELRHQLNRDIKGRSPTDLDRKILSSV